LAQGGVQEATFFVTTRGIGPANNGTKRLKAYIRAGHRLANHSHSHLWLRKTPVTEYLADLDKAVNILARFEAVDPWYRFPFLDEGRPGEKRDAVRAGLKARGLTNGYVTVDNYDWYMDSLFQKALKNGRSVDFEKLRDVYVATLVAGAEFYDALAVKVLGRSPAHVLLLHENDLAALFVADLADGLRAKGWAIISPREAYQDPIAAVTPNTLFLGQGRVGAIARVKGMEPAQLVSEFEDENYLASHFEDQGVFGAKPNP
jgi:peptidoglycan/xylan/chitin deacetylase (PgdA/CDA1 family)